MRLGESVTVDQVVAVDKRVVDEVTVVARFFLRGAVQIPSCGRLLRSKRTCKPSSLPALDRVATAEQAVVMNVVVVLRMIDHVAAALMKVVYLVAANLIC